MLLLLFLSRKLVAIISALPLFSWQVVDDDDCLFSLDEIEWNLEFVSVCVFGVCLGMYGLSSKCAKSLPLYIGLIFVLFTRYNNIDYNINNKVMIKLIDDNIGCNNNGNDNNSDNNNVIF